MWFKMMTGSDIEAVKSMKGGNRWSYGTCGCGGRPKFKLGAKREIIW